ncbi:MAG: V-type ATPase subunit [Treponema sp.]|jgi:vacuolar-type H+-ATPase subunit C/Vma6|nr:V-type ATPase subunit [Treponema sp.]
MTNPARVTAQGWDSPEAGERAYAYAKACGIIGKSFVGNRISALRELRHLSELDRLLFSETHGDLSTRELLSDMEKHIERRAVQQILAVVGSYTEPPWLLTHQLMVYEYNDLKICLHHIASGITKLHQVCDIGPYRTIHFEAFPDLEAMLHATEYKFILKKNIKDLKPDSKEFASIETELDTHYYLGLMDGLCHLSEDDRAIAQKILSEEISLRNWIWALRLRTYFKKSGGETRRQLMDIRTQTDPVKYLSTGTLQTIGFPLDSRAPWQGRKWEKFLNPEKPGKQWRIDPRYVQNAASNYLYQMALRGFHHDPMSVSAIFCFTKIKQFEEDLLTSIAEGLTMGISSADVFEMIGVAA